MYLWGLRAYYVVRVFWRRRYNVCSDFPIIDHEASPFCVATSVACSCSFVVALVGLLRGEAEFPCYSFEEGLCGLHGVEVRYLRFNGASKCEL